MMTIGILYSFYSTTMQQNNSINIHHFFKRGNWLNRGKISSLKDWKNYSQNKNQNLSNIEYTSNIVLASMHTHMGFFIIAWKECVGEDWVQIKSKTLDCCYCKIFVASKDEWIFYQKRCHYLRSYWLFNTNHSLQFHQISHRDYTVISPTWALEQYFTISLLFWNKVSGACSVCHFWRDSDWCQLPQIINV